LKTEPKLPNDDLRPTVPSSAIFGSHPMFSKCNIFLRCKLPVIYVMLVSK